MSEYLWVEKYRPHKIEDCVLPDRLKNIFQGYVEKGEFQHLMLSGPAGCGKTTVARALCEELGLNHMFNNSSETRGIDLIRQKVRNYASTVSLTGGRKVFIFDEADYLTNDGQAALRGSIEEFSDNCSFIITCNFKSKIVEAIHSRCAVIDCTLKSDEKPQMAAKMFKRVEQILIAEGIRYDKKVVAKMVERYFPDYRRLLNELQRHSVRGSIDAGIISQLDGLRGLGDLVKALKGKEFSDMRKWVANNTDVDTSVIFRQIYDGLNDFLKPESIPEAVVTLAKYQYQAAFVSDQELNLVACLTELMVSCEIK